MPNKGLCALTQVVHIQAKLKDLQFSFKNQAKEVLSEVHRSTVSLLLTGFMNSGLGQWKQGLAGQIILQLQLNYHFL